jgi:hypothetical protein
MSPKVLSWCLTDDRSVTLNGGAWSTQPLSRIAPGSAAPHSSDGRGGSGRCRIDVASAHHAAVVALGAGWIGRWTKCGAISTSADRRRRRRRPAEARESGPFSRARDLLSRAARIGPGRRSGSAPEVHSTAGSPTSSLTGCSVCKMIAETSKGLAALTASVLSLTLLYNA